MKYHHPSRKKVRSLLRHLANPVYSEPSALEDLIVILRLSMRNLGMLVLMLLFLLTVGALLDFMNPSLGTVKSLLEMVVSNLDFLGSVAFIASTFPLVWQFSAYKRGWSV